MTTLKPFKLRGRTYRVTGTFKKGLEWFHTVKCEETGEFKDKSDSWVKKAMSK